MSQWQNDSSFLIPARKVKGMLTGNLSSAELLDSINHSSYSYNINVININKESKCKPFPSFFKRKTKLPTRNDLDLLRRLLVLRNKLVKEGGDK